MLFRSLPAALAVATAAIVAVAPATLTATSASAAPATSAATSTVVASAAPTTSATTTSATTTSATTTSTTPGDTPVAITAVLTPRDRSGLRSLVQRTGGLGPAARAARIADVAPAAGRRSTVRRALTAAGFVVTGSRSWDVEATGTAAQAEALFGVDLVGTGDGIHPTDALTMPTSFHGAVSTVLGLDTRPIVSPSAIPGGLTPADLASAYSAPSSTSAGSGATIATIQFSGWNASDLSTYAAAAGRALPAVTQVAVDGASTTTVNGTGDLEVALDQEMLLAAAPAAAQRIYFAPLSASGMYDAYTQIAGDVASSHITAVSTSWGSCEASMSSGLRSVLEDAVDRIVAAGATMFAASGDTGASCDDGSGATTSVVFPASSPAVVGVGGTSLTRSGSTWSETTWNSSTGASGGGASATTKRPSYQSGVGIAGTTRLVPDIAAAADPSHGPGVYISAHGGWVLGGGTSLAAPLMAAQLTSSLAARGCSVGVGDVHAVLYAHPSDFRDVTTGTNGTAAAGVGYDEATGLGSPIWSALVQDLPVPSGCSTSTTTPTSTASPAASATPGISADGTRATGTTTLTAGQGIHSPSGQFRAAVTADGNLVETGNGRVLWSTTTSSHPGASFVLQADGDAVLQGSSGGAIWSTATSSSTAVTLGLSDTGLLTLSAGSTVLWSNGRPGADTLVPGAALAVGQSLWDTAGRRQLTLRSDGDLVVAIDGNVVWSSGTSGRGARRAVLGLDGSLVVVSGNGRVLWSSHTSGSGSAGVQLTMQSDGNLVLSRNGGAVWASGTAG